MEQFPCYLALGMSAAEYWDGDPWWAKSYRDAEKLKTEKLNRELWLQGMYFYDALCKVSPILHAFARGGTKPNPYPEEPYALTRKEDRDREETKAEMVETVAAELHPADQVDSRRQPWKKQEQL